MACAIETLVDLNTLALEELIGRLKATEERYALDGTPSGGDGGGGKLLLTEEEWFTRLKLREGDGSSGSNGHGRGRGKGRGRRRGGRGQNGRRGTSSGDKSKDTCCYCKLVGH